MARVTGIGGVFLKARDPEALAAWYAQYLGIKLNPYGGANLLWTDEVPEGTGMTTWSLFPEDTEYFGAGEQRTMVNYRVDDLEELVRGLEAAGAGTELRREDNAFGRFAWITDPEGNRMELWEPIRPGTERQAGS